MTRKQARAFNMFELILTSIALIFVIWAVIYLPDITPEKLNKAKLENKNWLDQYQENFRAYLEWREKQPCQDCGRVGKAGVKWADESQCLECFERLGPVEARGLTSAKELAIKANINV